MNHEEQIRRLVEKMERQECTPEELSQLYDWLEQRAVAGKPYEFTNRSERDEMGRRMLAAIDSAIENRGEGRNEGLQADDARRVGGNPITRTMHPAMGGWTRFAAAAIILIIMTAGVKWWIDARRGIIIASSAPGSIRKIDLPDGSTAWLNDNSEIAYHNDAAGCRSIELRKGEAFFEVKKDPGHVFRVRSGDLCTTVLGTSFSARMSPATGDLKVSVVTGKVMVTHKQDTLGYLLPSQRLKYDNRFHRVVLDTVLAGEAGGWIQGDIFLQNASLDEVIGWLQDHYKVTIQNQRPTYHGEYYLQAKSDIPLPEVLKILNLLGKKDHVQFSLQGQTITIQ